MLTRQGRLTLLASVALFVAGRLFGSVTAADVATALSKQAGTAIDKRKVQLSDPIKKLGTYMVSVKLHPKVSAKIQVDVQSDG